ncbi:hypothetical protein RhiirA5_403506 [Rhizophagus irregularis]|uniref:Wax synthase domain-containing protein n=1 Tax=Rhizophagus irregularis TaxID=588596 RepID=A0A2N0R1D0_9GLOM|nr:hypothetical protein RhiirA5_403506 [Rhizophagus irregularis]PKC57107.1 hypothetical protein RhiirA1_446312 [Rhizophagus irregularis]CAB4493970.1 unnamed protein product [Rhizophagus irregularis]CAB5099797.1 unnamed protein product [Rhizophagus irregularis]CAB5353755.1 unnamed protein product [Rhizophagus irregularis]
MSSTSRSNFFTKSNLVYIPFSITIAHILTFIVNSPSSTWQKFPPELPNSVYSSVFFAPILLFISLTYEPIHTRKRFYVLLSLALLFVSIPMIYRGNKSSLHNCFVTIALAHGMKMLLFLKLNRTYKYPKNSKNFKPYLWTLFNWRFNSYIIPPKSDYSNEKEKSLIIKSPTTSQINKRLLKCLMIIIAKWLMFELVFSTFLISTKWATETPEKVYQVRLLEFFTKGITPTTIPSILYILHFFACAYLWMSINYDAPIFIIAIIFRLFFHSTSKNNHYQSILIRFGFLNPSEYISLKEWMITLLFNTKPLFEEPWMASNPRDFWSTRWQLFLNEFLKEYGFLPVRNLLTPIIPRKIANMMGVLGAFAISSLLHEFLMIANFNIWTGEQSFFFMIHGLIFILWETIFGCEKKDEITMIKRVLKWVLLLVINLLILPAFVEPSLRNYKYSEISTLTSGYAQRYMKNL